MEYTVIDKFGNIHKVKSEKHESHGSCCLGMKFSKELGACDCHYVVMFLDSNEEVIAEFEKPCGIIKHGLPD